MDTLLLSKEKESQDDSNEIIYFSINHSYSCIAVGTKSGFKIYSTDPFQLYYESKTGPMTIVEMLNETNIVLLVGLVDFGDFSPRNITMWNTNKSAVICKTQFEHPITLAKINNKYIIVVVLDKMHVYTLSKIERYHTFEIGYVVLGKLALSPSSDKNNYVCCSSNEGMVKVYDLTERCSKASIKAHKSPILKMVMNLKGDKLATCSCKGTIIRIFSVPKGEKIITYKRGVYSAYMFSLNFSFDDEKLITTSDTGTVHVFDLKADLKGEEGRKKTQKSYGVAKFFSRICSSIAIKVLPKSFEDMLQSSRSILAYRSPHLKISNIASFFSKSNNEAYCFTSDGSIYLFNISYETKNISKIYEGNVKDIKLKL